MDRRKIIVGSDGMGRWGIFTINTVLKIAYPDCQIEWSNNSQPDLVVKSHFTKGENIAYTCPYVTWSGESIAVRYPENKPPICQITSHIALGAPVTSFHVPFATDHMSEKSMWLEFAAGKSVDWKVEEYLPSSQLFADRSTDEKRPYFCAYMNGNAISERERLFNLLLQRKGHLTCHALGKCSNNIDQIKTDTKIHAHVCSYMAGRGDDTIYGGNAKIFKHYRFALVMENANLPGYVTEKLVNAFKAGTIPIYWGGGGYADQIFNPKAFIDVSKFNSLEACADYIVKVDDNPSLFAQMRKEHIFTGGEVPDIFRGLQSKSLACIAEHLKKQLQKEITETKAPAAVYMGAHTPAVKDDLPQPTFYCINLESSKTKRAGMEARFKLLGAKHVMVNAVTRDCGLIEFYLKDHHSNNSLSDLIPDNVARAASHFKALRLFLETNEDEAFICEDNIVFRKEFRAMYTKGRQNMLESCPLVTFSYIITKWGTTSWSGKDPKMKNLSSIDPQNTWSSQMYWISRAYAIEVLERYDRSWYMLPWMRLNEMYIKDSKGCLHYPPLAIEEDSGIDHTDRRKIFDAWVRLNYVHE